ncbi:Hint domain-containing protein [Amylibacter sp. SFDW26]|uniref:Hint domain-containing protein n=1 Tax=Amylibacter sp. SFDW26 TaxID=2652722 RepID=UPI0012627D49|nr:Hint domain-containing protein [Amylibacter sp. SFDW26]KAB7616044.1 Hint domain-containing protein [Amylibacter sp. SFDW26]
MPQQFLSIQVNGDPLGGGPLTAGIVETVTVVDDDGFLQSGGQDVSGTAQFQIGGADFTTTSWPGDQGTGIEIYSATVNGQPVTFGYLTASGDGVDDAINRLVVLSGTINPGDIISTITAVSTDTQLPYTKGGIPSITCFTPGTTITTPTGPVAVENLKTGDLVITADNGLQAIRWVGRKYISGARMEAHPHLRPVRIRAHSFGRNKPERDLVVSPQHRIFIKSKQAQVMFGSHEVLIPAKGLLNDHTITLDHNAKATEYIHILFDNHELIEANGIWSESFHPNKASVDGLDDDARNELFEIFPELNNDIGTYGPSARQSLSVTEAATLQSKSKIKNSSYRLTLHHRNMFFNDF